MTILALLLLLGVTHADPSLMVATPWTWVVTAAGLLYVTFQGFGVVTNAAEDMKSPKTELPKAMFLALAIVLLGYLLVSLLVVCLLSVVEIEQDAGHVLAIAGAAVLGQTGFLVIAAAAILAAAILATASAVNATLFASANIGADLAVNGQLTSRLAQPWLGRGTVAFPYPPRW